MPAKEQVLNQRRRGEQQDPDYQHPDNARAPHHPGARHVIHHRVSSTPPAVALAHEPQEGGPLVVSPSL